MKRATSCFAWGLTLHPTHRTALGLRDGVKATLAGHRVVYTANSPAWPGRVGAVVPAPGHQVVGLLFKPDDASWAKLEAFERGQGGVPLTVKVRARFDELPATLFTPAPQATGGLVDLGWMEQFLQGLADPALPADALLARQAEALIAERVQTLSPPAVATPKSKPAPWSPT